MKRRDFFQLSAAAVGSFAISDSLALMHKLKAQEKTGSAESILGPIKPVKDQATGLELLLLPNGFSYTSFGWSKDMMDDGVKTPGAHDGMGVVATNGSEITLIRNHEVGGARAAFGSDSMTFDSMAGGGCTTLVFDVDAGELKKSHSAISGTVRNCAGGVTPWGTWLTCEETVDGLEKEDEKTGYQKEHGWIFEVPADGSATAKPIKEMGRFVHEAVAVDPNTGYVYETEDRGFAGLYRFIPKVKGKLSDGGKLQMLKVPGNQNLTGSSNGKRVFENIEWVSIDEPTLAHSPGTTNSIGCFAQGVKNGGTAFSRLEGCWYGGGLIYFSATSGGEAGKGQIWSYDPKENVLNLIYESPGVEVLNYPDNIAISPNGGIAICEDGSTDEITVNGKKVLNYPRLHGLTPEGELFTLSRNNCVLKGERNGFSGDYRKREWAGATFSPDGKWLFVNMQSPGISLAITGPWDKVGF